MTWHVVALSGGKDSTAMALRLAEVAPRDYLYFCTPTGDELPVMHAHWAHLERLLGQPILHLQLNGGLAGLIDHWGALPNWRQRWCTRQLKIEVAERLYDVLSIGDDVEVYVGLRADEEGRDGSYSERFKHHYPFRDWGWGIKEVWAYLNERGVSIPRRTDCARCFFQRLHEWFELYRDYPDLYQSAVDDETRTGYTYRSPSRDTQPASLAELREKFKNGYVPRNVASTGDVYDFAENKCRVCSL